MTTAPSLHVVFGTVPVGTTLAHDLVAGDGRFSLVNRSRTTPASPPADVELVAGDAANPTPTQELSSGTALLTCTHAPYERWHEVLPHLQEHMADARLRGGLR